MKLSKKYFNMVEIVLALAVVSVAIVSLMGMLPVALRASKNSVADNSVATVAEIMKAYIDARYNNVSAGNFSNFYSSFPTSENVSTINTSFEGGTGIFGNNGPIEIYNLNNGLFRVDFYSGDLSNASARTTDFSAGVHIWKESMNGNIYVPQNVFAGTPSSSNIGSILGNSVISGSNVTDPHVVTMVMRISFPADASFANQEHRYYKFDYFAK